MALTWTAKAPAAIRKYEWTPLPGTPLDSVSVAVSSGTVTVTGEAEGDTAVFTVSGGADGVVQVLAVSARTGDETLSDTVYLPVEAATNRLGYTVRDICLFALRKIAGVGEVPDADELADALERLNDRVALWRRTGADLGVTLPLAEGDVLNITDSAYLALKLQLRNELHEFYGHPLTQSDVLDARAALAAVKNSFIVHRAPGYF